MGDVLTGAAGIGSVRRALRSRSVVSLLRPPVVVLPGSLATHGPTPPLGLAYVAAALRDAGHEVSLVDGAGEAIEQITDFDSPVGGLQRIGLTAEQIVDRIDPRATIIGITNMFLHEWPQVKVIARLARKRFPEATIVMGGENATAFASWILEQSDDIDACVMGEGEGTMVSLADRLAEGKPLVPMAGITVRDGLDGAVVDSGLSIRMGRRELDSAPRPAWDLVPLENYWAHYPFFGVHRGRSMQVLGTRGCPYKCSFCSSPHMWTTKYVVREPDDVVDEIVYYRDHYGVQNINFVDLTAATNRKWTLGLCDAMERRASGMTWQLPVGTRIEAIDREVLQRIYDTGCKNITFAPESGSERVLKVMDKRVKLPKVLQAVRDGNEIGLRTTVNILIGHPEERWSDVWKSAKFLLRCAWEGCSDIAVMMFCPYPGSDDYQNLLDSGDHTIDEAAYYVGLSRSSSSHRSWNKRMSPAQLRMLQLSLISAFYLTSMGRRPRRIIAFLRAQLFGGSEDTYLDQMVRTRRKKVQRIPDAEVPERLAS